MTEKKKTKIKLYSKKDLRHFEKIISEKKKEIFENLEILKESMQETEPGEYNNEAMNFSMHSEQSSESMEREKVFLFASRESKFLNYLDDALRRIKQGNFGICIECQKLISKKRLEAVPHAQLCVKCKLKKKSGKVAI